MIRDSPRDLLDIPYHSLASYCYRFGWQCCVGNLHDSDWNVLALTHGRLLIGLNLWCLMR